MINVRDTLVLGIARIQDRRKDISDIVSLIADLATPKEVVKLAKEDGIYISFGSNNWWKVSVGNNKGKILIQYGVGGLTLFDSWVTGRAEDVEEVWDVLGELITGIQDKAPDTFRRLKPFFEAGQAVQDELISAARA